LAIAFHIILSLIKSQVNTSILEFLSLILGILCNRKSHEIDTLQSVNHTYLRAIEAYMDVQPLLIPASVGPDAEIHAELILDRIDGLLIPGNRSNLHPSLYGGRETPAHGPFDRQRDAAALALITGAIAKNLPILAICRGLQELNVVCGGSLNAELHVMDDKLDHRTPQIPEGYDETQAAETIYAASHRVRFPANGYFQQLLQVETAQTNSLHRQGIDRLGAELCVEAVAEDGTIEAVRHVASDYCFGVQWHPEMQSGENKISAPLFRDFNRAMRAHMEKHRSVSR
jgi:putative glutamine amidotransferase